MQRDPRKFLYDIQEACRLIIEFSEGKSLCDYQEDKLLRSGIERQFMIVGEALMQALKAEPSLATRIPESRNIVGFRHLLVHGYAVVKPDVVWGILQNDVPPLLGQVEQLLVEM